MVKECSQCKSKELDSAKFCTKCGANLEKPKKEETKAPFKSKKVDLRKIIAIIVFIFVVIILLMAGLYMHGISKETVKITDIDTDSYTYVSDSSLSDFTMHEYEVYYTLDASNSNITYIELMIMYLFRDILNKPSYQLNITFYNNDSVVDSSEFVIRSFSELNDSRKARIPSDTPYTVDHVKLDLYSPEDKLLGSGEAPFTMGEMVV